MPYPQYVSKLEQSFLLHGKYSFMQEPRHKKLIMVSNGMKIKKLEQHLLKAVYCWLDTKLLSFKSLECVLDMLLLMGGECSFLIF